MPRDAKIMSEALHRFQADKERRNARLERRTEEIYRRVPAVERIDRELRGTAARIVAAAFSEGGDPEKALEQLAAAYNERIASRVLCGCTSYSFAGKDIRFLKQAERRK